jgi:hypothetical protein
MVNEASGWPGDSFFRAYLDAYCDSWNREDLEAILDAYHLPCFIYKRGTLFALLEEGPKRDYFAEFVEVNRQEGPATWEIAGFSLVEQGRSSALVVARWLFRRPDGSVVWDFVDSHHVCRLDGRWKFLDRTLHD